MAGSVQPWQNNLIEEWKSLNCTHILTATAFSRRRYFLQPPNHNFGAPTSEHSLEVLDNKEDLRRLQDFI